MIKIDTNKCIGCGSCYDVCPDYVYAKRSETPKIRVVYPDHCCSCGHCVAVCPKEAVIHETLPLSLFETIPEGNSSQEAIRPLILSRRSVRKYKAEKISEEITGLLVEAAIHAGTGGNIQSEDILFIQDPSFLKKLELSVIDTLWKGGIRFFTGKGVLFRILKRKFGTVLTYQYSKYNKIIRRRRENNDLAEMVFRGAPLVMVVHGLKENNLAQTNAALAMRNVELMAQSLGLGTCYSGFLVSASEMNRKRINRALSLDNDRQVFGALMIGYPKYRYPGILPPKELGGSLDLAGLRSHRNRKGGSAGSMPLSPDSSAP